MNMYLHLQGRSYPETQHIYVDLGCFYKRNVLSYF